MSNVDLRLGDCRDILTELEDDSVDSIVTDPPYELGFMSKKWDNSGIAFDVEMWEQCLRVLKPGGHLLAFGGSRTWHRLTVAIEDAGFEIRDSIAWLYGSGFPKSLDVSKAIDKARDDRDDVLQVTSTLADLAAAAGITRADIDAHMGTSDMGGWWLSTLRHRCACPSIENWTRLRDFIPGATALDDLVWKLNGRKGSPGEAWGQREVIGSASVPIGHAFAGSTYGGDSSGRVVDITAPATPDAKRWQGWGTALKPAFEPIVVARKPLVGTVAANVLEHGTGALNIDACRTEYEQGGSLATNPSLRSGISGGNGGHIFPTETERRVVTPHASGRWPTNVVLDEAQAAELDKQSGNLPGGVTVRRNMHGQEQNANGIYGSRKRYASEDFTYGDSGGASRFFPVFKYQAKAPTKERPKVDGVAHPTVKPLELMRWLVKLVTPPGGVVLDPFAGSGTTVEACLVEGFDCIAIENEADYIPLIEHRISRSTT
uniref:DNA methyltransferase n=1 Tax=Mycobacterium phage TwoPeat TaxID=3158882 RepID=A0AAU8GR39_9CAUD